MLKTRSSLRKIVAIAICLIGFLTNNVLAQQTVSGIEEMTFPVGENGNEEISEIVEISMTKNKLYSNAQEWITRTFGDYKSVIQFEDPQNGRLIIKGLSRINYVEQNQLGIIKEKMNYTITIDCKDHKYRYIISDINIISSFIVFGHENNSKITHNSHLETINKSKLKKPIYQAKLDSLLNIDIKILKKKEKKDIKEEIEKTKTSISYNDKFGIDSYKFYKEEYETINLLTSSLKSSMAKNDDF